MCRYNLRQEENLSSIGFTGLLYAVGLCSFFPSVEVVSFLAGIFSANRFCLSICTFPLNATGLILIKLVKGRLEFNACIRLPALGKCFETHIHFKTIFIKVKNSV